MKKNTKITSTFRIGRCGNLINTIAYSSLKSWLADNLIPTEGNTICRVSTKNDMDYLSKRNNSLEDLITYAKVKGYTFLEVCKEEAIKETPVEEMSVAA